MPCGFISTPFFSNISESKVFKKLPLPHPISKMDKIFLLFLKHLRIKPALFSEKILYIYDQILSKIPCVLLVS